MKPRGNLLHRRCAPLACAAMALLLTGCPHKEYSVRLQPEGDRIARTLEFYCADGVTASNTPNYRPFGSPELAAITALYPAHSLTDYGERHVIRGEFTHTLPNDVGGSGAYLHLATTLGEAGFYSERFRGNDDLAGMFELRFKAADQLADLILGWSRAELGREPGYDKLRRFLDVDFRRDLRNAGEYCWEGQQLTGGFGTNAGTEFAVRFGQYLYERGYFTVQEIPGLFKDVSAENSQPILRRVQRLVARNMGVPETEPVPASLAFLADDPAVKKSLDAYLSGTEAYQAKLKKWEEDKKLKPDAKKPEPSVVADDITEDLLASDLSGEPDHLAVRLSLPAPPDQSNGRWDGALKQVVWETDIEERTQASHFPFSCYASWTQADREFQTGHFGKVILTGDELAQYCLWRAGENAQRGAEWDAFLAALHPGEGLVKTLDSFRFAGEPAGSGTNTQQKISGLSDLPRRLLKSALR